MVISKKCGTLALSLGEDDAIPRVTGVSGACRFREDHWEGYVPAKKNIWHTRTYLALRKTNEEPPMARGKGTRRPRMLHEQSPMTQSSIYLPRRRVPYSDGVPKTAKEHVRCLNLPCRSILLSHDQVDVTWVSIVSSGRFRIRKVAD